MIDDAADRQAERRGRRGARRRSRGDRGVVGSGRRRRGGARAGVAADRHAHAAGDLRRRPAAPDAQLGRRARPSRPRAGARRCSCRTTSSTAASTCTPARRWRACSSSGVVPIINENDAIANDEIRYGDNDRLAALVAHNLGADVLRAAHRPRRPVHGRSAASTPTPRSCHGSSADDPLLRSAPTPAAAGGGAAGMASKLEAARIASWSGVPHRDRQRRPARRAARRRRAASRSARRFEARTAAPAGARKLWIAFAAQVRRHGHGRRRRPAGARRALDEPAAGRGRRRRRARSSRATRSRSRDVDGVACSPAAWCPSTPPSLRRVAGRTPATSPTAWPTRSSTATTSCVLPRLIRRFCVAESSDRRSRTVCLWKSARGWRAASAGAGRASGGVGHGSDGAADCAVSSAGA